jgi:hypothetical protein
MARPNNGGLWADQGSNTVSQLNLQYFVSYFFARYSISTSPNMRVNWYAPKDQNVC